MFTFPWSFSDSLRIWELQCGDYRVNLIQHKFRQFRCSRETWEERIQLPRNIIVQVKWHSLVNPYLNWFWGSLPVDPLNKRNGVECSSPHVGELQYLIMIKWVIWRLYDWSYKDISSKSGLFWVSVQRVLEYIGQKVQVISFYQNCTLI